MSSSASDVPVALKARAHGQVPLRMNVGGAEVRHGYSMARLHLLARKAALMSNAHAQPFAEKYETAWQAIAEHLSASEDPPVFYELTITGRTAVDQEFAQLSRSHGRHYGHGVGGGEPMQAFSRYWDWHARRPGSPEDQVIDPLALRQIWPRLSDTHRAVLMALAIHGEYARAAASLGKTYRTFSSLLHNARRQFMRLWHEGETPPARLMWTTDNRNARSSRYTVAATIRSKRDRRAGKARRP